MLVDGNLVWQLDDGVDKVSMVEDVIQQRSMNVVYQPIVNHTQDCVLGYEALTRPILNGQFIRPDTWFRAAYDLNYSVEADLLALSCIFQDTSFFVELPETTLLFVNVMPSSLQDTKFLMAIESMFDQGHCQPNRLVFEIVEYIEYDPQRISIAVSFLRSLGARIALDDFGVERAHSDAISVLNPDFVKMDKSLISDVEKRERIQISSLGSLQQTRGAHCIIAEGIESADDLAVVKAMEIPLGQGYYWGKPASSKEIQQLVMQIEQERKTLETTARQMDDALTDPLVVDKSQQLDKLIFQYQQLQCLSK